MTVPTDSLHLSENDHVARSEPFIGRSHMKVNPHSGCVKNVLEVCFTYGNLFGAGYTAHAQVRCTELFVEVGRPMQYMVLKMQLDGPDSMYCGPT